MTGWKMSSMRARLALLGAVVAALLVAPTGNTAVWPFCGYPVYGPCPSCEAESPGDGTCYCGVDGEACNCIKISGGRQLGQVIYCMTGAFYAMEDNNGFLLESAGPATCAMILKCMKGGSQLNCGTYEQPGVCTWQYGQPSCDWNLFDWTNEDTVQATGDKCFP